MNAQTNEILGQASAEDPPKSQTPPSRRAPSQAWEPQLETQRVVSEPEAAAFIGLSLPQLRRLRRQRRAPDHVRLSERRLGYRIAALIAFLDSRTVTETAEAQ